MELTLFPRMAKIAQIILHRLFGRQIIRWAIGLVSRWVIRWSNRQGSRQIIRLLMLPSFTGRGAGRDGLRTIPALKPMAAAAVPLAAAHVLQIAAGAAAAGNAVVADL
jgi:hypothetical protein